jgi:hypothetical protein
MAARERKIAQAWLESPTRGIIELTHDWRARHTPPLVLAGIDAPRFTTLTKVPDYTYGAASAYFANRKGEIFFFLRLDRYPQLGAAGVNVYLAGDFNGWQNAVGQEEWRLKTSTLAGYDVLMLTGSAERFFGQPPMRFKFVTGEHQWLDVPADAPNAVRDSGGNVNYVVDPSRTGQHLYQFSLIEPVDLAAGWTVSWQGAEQVPLRPGEYFYQLESRAPLGDGFPLVRAAGEARRALRVREARVSGIPAPLSAREATRSRVGGDAHAESARLVLLVPRGRAEGCVRFVRSREAHPRSLRTRDGEPLWTRHCFGSRAHRGARSQL